MYTKTFYILILALFSTVSLAETFTGIHPLQHDRFVFEAGAFVQDVSGDFAIDNATSGEDGTDFSIGDDSQVEAAINAMWRITDNIRLEAEYFRLSHSTDKRTSKRSILADLELDSGVYLASDIELDVSRAFLGYSFIKNNISEIGIGAAAYYFNLDIDASSIATVGGIGVTTERSISDWIALPSVGFYANYALSPKWIVAGRVDWFGANISDYDGTFLNAEARVQYQMFDHLGMGVAYKHFEFQVDKGDNDGDWHTDVETSGPVLFLSANF